MSDVLPVLRGPAELPAAWRDPVAFENGTRPLHPALYAAQKKEPGPSFFCARSRHYRDSNKRVSIPLQFQGGIFWRGIPVAPRPSCVQPVARSVIE